MISIECYRKENGAQTTTVGGRHDGRQRFEVEVEERSRQTPKITVSHRGRFDETGHSVRHSGQRPQAQEPTPDSGQEIPRRGRQR